jgi:hypothetical protein
MNFTTSAWPFFDANSAAGLLARLIDISTLPKQQLYNSRMPTSRRGVQYSPAVAVHSMHSRSVVAGPSSLSLRCLFSEKRCEKCEVGGRRSGIGKGARNGKCGMYAPIWSVMKPQDRPPMPQPALAMTTRQEEK